ncbi:hypothetical protein BOFE_05990 [Candidatus Borrelia fainii]|uniref:Uncharacterized protein n=1 Tax=Candidatus Borrelia fainii TaxID=2518322 RepID=A0ABN6US17_9SPIR|nr:hypothetical protein [Candidatus Borrelia fainii]BDU63059.1 hypothetical protein BOFE_05990 [Candidatus Borrelia fainii]
MKGFLAIRLSNDEYFSVLSLDDADVKRVVLGKIADETNVRLDFYVSEHDDFSNSVIIGSFFLDNLRKESVDINVYFKIDSMMLYVYGECDGIVNKSKFDLSLINFAVGSEKINDLESSAKSSDLPVGFSGVERKEEFVEEFGSVAGRQYDSLDGNLDNFNDLPNSQNLSADEKLFSNENNFNLLSDSLNPDNGTLVSENFDSDSDINLENFDFGLTGDGFENNIDGGNEIEEHVLDDKDTVSRDVFDLDNVSVDISDSNDAFNNSAANVVKLVEDEDTDFKSVNVYTLQDSYSDNWNVEDIITDLDNGSGELELDDVALDFGKEDFATDIEESSLDLDSEEGLMQTSMLYLSLISLFFLIFFSLFLIFSKLLNHRNFAIYDCPFYREEKITKCENSNYV